MRRAPIFRKRPSRRPWFFAILFLAGIGLAWAYGFIRFVEQIPERVVDAETRTDAIVVLTGGSNRLEVGVRLYRSAMGGKLFISGVNARVQARDILPEENLASENADCCIKLGYEARDTIGNARETASWATKEKLQSLRLVTANYHMPRSLLEFRQVLPNLKIIPHPVFPKNFHRNQWWRWPGSAKLALLEYHKFLLAHLRFFASKIMYDFLPS
ncbi:MAG: hypothetical protein COA65_06445 [Rhodospirillaceae bacterium]|nr:MAG: hypothetical protein COA65_06445 [Rhodospirillaceae bacterium]